MYADELIGEQTRCLTNTTIQLTAPSTTEAPVVLWTWRGLKMVDATHNLTRLSPLTYFSAHLSELGHHEIHKPKFSDIWHRITEFTRIAPARISPPQPRYLPPSRCFSMPTLVTGKDMAVCRPKASVDYVMDFATFITPHSVSLI